MVYIRNIPSIRVGDIEIIITGTRIIKSMQPKKFSVSLIKSNN
jgi:hypothetical protein